MRNRICLRSTLGRDTNYNIAHAQWCVGDLREEPEENYPSGLCAERDHDIWP